MTRMVSLGILLGLVVLFGLLSLRVMASFLLPLLLAETVIPSIVLFVIIYGLDWVATVPPTAAIHGPVRLAPSVGAAARALFAIVLP